LILCDIFQVLNVALDEYKGLFEVLRQFGALNEKSAVIDRVYQVVNGLALHCYLGRKYVVAHGKLRELDCGPGITQN
jgi:hypothetical protein